MGTVTCILGALPLFAVAMRAEEDFMAVAIFVLLFVLEGIGVSFFVVGGINQASFEKLLQEGEYSVTAKKKSPLVSAVSTAYWLIVTAIFLGVSLPTNEWQTTGYIWPIAGVFRCVIV